jgi:tetratricopeptide (TPR) repeat protein
MSGSTMRGLLSLTLASALSISAQATLAQATLAQGVTHHEHAPGAHTGERLGVVSFPNSGAHAAQQPFLRGLALLHNFEYDDARAAFRAAERADSGFAMAYWGEALTFAQLLWGLDYADSARATLAKLGPTTESRLARAGSARERHYGAAIEALFESSDLPTRVRGYIAGLRAVTAAYPSDLDARALLAISLLLDESGTPAEQRARTEESIRLAQSVLTAQPNHPGGAHYLIHAADDPRYAPRALAAARAYARIAPDAEHALHMPSHIFVQVGAWDDVVSSNERSWAASRAWVKSHGVAPTELGFHTLWWLQYGYLQQGRFAAARALIDTARAVLAGIDWATSDAIDARYAVEQLRFSYAWESGDWTVYAGRAPALAVRNAKDSSDRTAYFAAIDTYQVAFIAAQLGDTTRANAIIATRPASAVISRGEIAGLGARVRGDTATWIAHLQAAAKADGEVVHLGPPNVFPPHEMLGNALLELGRAKEAIAAYEKELELMPNRSNALLGLARAQRAVGDSVAAARTAARVRANWHAADAGVVSRIASRE